MKTTGFPTYLIGLKILYVRDTIFSSLEKVPRHSLEVSLNWIFLKEALTSWTRSLNMICSRKQICKSETRHSRCRLKVQSQKCDLVQFALRIIITSINLFKMSNSIASTRFRFKFQSSREEQKVNLFSHRRPQQQASNIENSKHIHSLCLFGLWCAFWFQGLWIFAI